MKKNLICWVSLVLVALFLFAPSCWAKENGYCYVIGYSILEQKAFFSPVFVQKVKSKSYSEEEYVTDMDLIRSMESQFQKRLAVLVNLDKGQYTVSARGAYKSNSIANKKYKDELERYKTKGYAIKLVNDFKFSD